MISARKGAGPWGGVALGVLYEVHGRGSCPCAHTIQMRHHPQVQGLLLSQRAFWCSNPVSSPLVALPFFGRANFEAGGPRQGVEAQVRLAGLGLHRCTRGEGSERTCRRLHPCVLAYRIFVVLTLRTRGV